MLKEVLESVLSPEESSLVYSAFDQIGSIVIIKIPDALMSKKGLIAQAILDNIKTAKSVFAQVSAVQGDFRVRDLEYLAGEKTTMTEYKEHGCRFKVDVAKAYFSPRLSTERKRIAEMVQDNEIIVNMFAGVGTYSIVIAKANKTCKIYSIDSNRAAAELCTINAKLNKVQDRVESICGDAASVIKDRLAGSANRVLMPLPERAKEFVNDAVLALKPGGGIVHYFAHVKADSKKASQDAGLADAKEAFSKYNYDVRGIRIVREVGPRLYQIVADVFATR
ncbi:MAG TPA: class I SAM-dependent methyltransferase family protein [Nitrososphaera sp.]|nr:class I SAM-dependent methyltransferase family protein [Nitrososphaera sp.]